ncbi:hypothetical protein Leryth_010959 [Lithospermum erythrorhizon]|nr:hypothetical protein Leryth_010959 [Lithospermum erythrorhizon]
MKLMPTNFGTARFLSHNSSYWTSFLNRLFGYSSSGMFSFSPNNNFSQQHILQKRLLSLEVLMGTHPGDLSSSHYHLPTLRRFCWDVIDQRISHSRNGRNRQSYSHYKVGICMSATKSSENSRQQCIMFLFN